MSAKWYFHKLEAGAIPEIDPQSDEFFNREEKPEAIVREAIQNSLDAKRGNSDFVKVIFSLKRQKKDKIYRYFDELNQHLSACKIKIDDHIQLIDFLTIEDFGTTGLIGKIYEGEEDRPDGSKYYNFWYREGKSEKEGTDNGRRGIGKTTFHNASKAKSFFGLTSRFDDNEELLLGKAQLVEHKVQNVHYNYYGYYTAGNAKSIKDKKFLLTFKKCFSLVRENEPGLSLVIPFSNESITYNALISAIIIHYSYAIFKERLVVIVNDDNNDIHKEINAKSIMEIASSNDWRDTSWDKRDVEQILLFIKNAAQGNAKQIIELPDVDIDDIISEKSFDNKLSEIRNMFNEGSLLSFKIPITILKLNSKTKKSYFSVFIQKFDDLNTAEEFFIRSSITIPHISRKQSLGNRPVRAILIADDDPISGFLGDAEPPAHTDWNGNTKKFQDNYDTRLAKIQLRFIKTSIGKIVSILDKAPVEIQYDFLQDIFYILDESNEPGQIKSKRRKIKIEKRKPIPFELSRSNNGFKVKLNKNTTLPIYAHLLVAYDTRKGNAFNQYDLNDFSFKNNMMKINHTGCIYNVKNDNEILIEVQNTSFALEVMGFDPKRDIIIDVKEVLNEKEV